MGRGGGVGRRGEKGRWRWRKGVCEETGDGGAREGGGGEEGAEPQMGKEKEGSGEMERERRNEEKRGERGNEGLWMEKEEGCVGR